MAGIEWGSAAYGDFRTYWEASASRGRPRSARLGALRMPLLGLSNADRQSAGPPSGCLYPSAKLARAGQCCHWSQPEVRLPQPASHGPMQRATVRKLARCPLRNFATCGTCGRRRVSGVEDDFMSQTIPQAHISSDDGTKHAHTRLARSLHERQSSAQCGFGSTDLRDGVDCSQGVDRRDDLGHGGRRGQALALPTRNGGIVQRGLADGG